MTPDGRVVWMAEVREINPEVPPSGEGCAECLAADPPGWWFHLRRCATCGHIGCCDSSPSQHARAHFHAAKVQCHLGTVFTNLAIGSPSQLDRVLPSEPTTAQAE